MLEKRLLEEILGIAVSTGADFAEVYAERTRNNGIRFINGKIDTANDGVTSGVGIRAFIGTRTVYATTTDFSRSGLIRCARAVADALGESNAQVSIHLTERIFPNIHPVKILPGSTPMKMRTDILKEACFAASERDE